MSKDGILIEWYEARDVFLGLNGKLSCFWQGQKMTEACVSKYGDNCPEDAKWLFDLLPVFQPYETVDGIDVKMRFLASLKDASTDYAEGRALCFAGLCHVVLDMDLVRRAASKGYPLAVGVLASFSFVDAVHDSRFPANLEPPEMLLRDTRVEEMALKYEEPRCLYRMVRAQIRAGTVNGAIAPGWWNANPGTRRLLRRSAELGIRVAQHFYAVHCCASGSRERIFWLAKAAQSIAQARGELAWLVVQKHDSYFMQRVLEDGECIYDIGKYVDPGLYSHVSQTASMVAINNCVDTARQWDGWAYEAVNAWLLIARRGVFSGLCADIRKIVGKMIWAFRTNWPVAGIDVPFCPHPYRPRPPKKRAKVSENQ